MAEWYKQKTIGTTRLGCRTRGSRFDASRFFLGRHDACSHGDEKYSPQLHHTIAWHIFGTRLRARR